MMKFTKTLLLLFLLPFYSYSGIRVSLMTCEHAETFVVINTQIPRFGWKLESDINGAYQTAYEIMFSSNPVFFDENNPDMWNSGKVLSSQSHYIEYKGKPLEKGKYYYWKVRVWDNSGKVSEWSKTASFMTAPDINNRGAKWIGAISREDAKLPEGNIYHRWGLAKELAAKWDNIDSLSTKSILLRKDFSLADIPKQAIINISGLGHYEVYVNGTRVGESVFGPLWSDYNKTVYYNTYDISHLLRKGENTIGVMLGNGMYNVTGGRYYKFKGSFGPPTLLMCAEIINGDNSITKIVSDDSWHWSLSPIVFNCIFGGEDYDARSEQKGWSSPGFDKGKWQKVVVQKPPKGILTPQLAKPVTIAEVYPVIDYKKTGANKYLFDFGQNHSGYPTIKVKGRRGQKVCLRPGETLTDAGQAVNQKGSGDPYWFEYIIKGDSVEMWTPSFSYYGYRYIEIENVDYLEGDDDTRPVLLDIKSNFIHSSAKATGSFECSNELFNRIHFIIDKAVRSNMQAVFTDCPHREKLGWLEETHLNGSGLLFNYDLRRFLPKVMQDIADAQLDNGLIPDIAPEYTVFKDGFRDSPEWGVAGVIVPWMYYEWYGDDSLIKEYYDVMKKYTDYLTTQANDYILMHGLGDWYDYGTKPVGISQNTPPGITSTGHFYMCADYTARAAALLGKKENQNKYSELAKNISAAFNNTFFDTATCRYGNGSQCSYAMPLFLNIVPQEYKEEVLNKLLSAIEEKGWKLSTGDIGNRYLYGTLSMNGFDEVMYRMHNHKDVPGYGFQIGLGVTTLTEQWDPRKGHSWNHFMMGQVEEWFWKSLIGIGPDIENPGFSHFYIEPKPVGDLKWIKASFESIYGTVGVDWRIENKKFTTSIQVPVNTTATLKLPFGDKRIKHLKSGKYTFTVNVEKKKKK
ncbi:glycoside hydrolase family 78 protein [Dysgonomonas reticulitermitis]